MFATSAYDTRISSLLKFVTCNGRNYETRRAITRSRYVISTIPRLDFIDSSSLDQNHAGNVTKGKNGGGIVGVFYHIVSFISEI